MFVRVQAAPGVRHEGMLQQAGQDQDAGCGNGCAAQHPWVENNSIDHWERIIYPARMFAICHFSSFFFHGSHSYILLFNTSIASVGTAERVAKIRVAKYPIFKFLCDFQICQNGPKVSVECVSSFLLAQQFPDFWTLSNWARVLKFWVGVGIGGP